MAQWLPLRMLMSVNMPFSRLRQKERQLPENKAQKVYI